MQAFTKDEISLGESTMQVKYDCLIINGEDLNPVWDKYEQLVYDTGYLAGKIENANMEHLEFLESLEEQKELINDRIQAKLALLRAITQLTFEDNALIKKEGENGKNSRAV